MMAAVFEGLVRGSPGAQLVRRSSPLPDDAVVVKKRFSAFAGTNLHELLLARRIESLLLVGGTTTVCVESTLRDAMFLEYNGVVLADCTADMTEACIRARSRASTCFSAGLLPWTRYWQSCRTVRARESCQDGGDN